MLGDVPHGIAIVRERIDDAIRLALARTRLDTGSRYHFVVSLVKVEGAEPYQGAGI